VTDSNNGSAGTDGGVTTKLWARIQILMQFSRSVLAPVGATPRERTDASADATEEQADGDGAEADPDGLMNWPR